MTGDLAACYSETLQAQAGMQRLADALKGTVPPPAEWNAIEESLEAALGHFQNARATYLHQTPRNPASPGLAGV